MENQVNQRPSPAASDTLQQRKQVTVLFADVQGFTSMSEAMDAEDLADLMNALWEQLDAVILMQGGYIDKHIGDAVMALWGVQQVNEADPENAIRAALGMQAALTAFRVIHGYSLGMRIGIHTGSVLLGEVGTTHEFTALGDTVNLASRLEHAAPVDCVLISHSTYQHIHGAFDLKALEPIRVKGKSELIQVYLVEQARPRAFHTRQRGVEGVETHLVGRDSELDLLKAAFNVMLAGGSCQAVTVIGDAGVGKSRLLFEFENWLENHNLPELLFKGRAFPQTRGQPCALLRNLFAFYFQIHEDDRLATVQEKLESGLGENLGMDGNGRMQAHFIGYLLGYDFSASPYLVGVQQDADQIHSRAVGYLTDYFRKALRCGPLVLLLEDLHWADDISLDILNTVVHELAGGRLLLVGSARPELMEHRGAWEQGLPNPVHLELQPLSGQDSRTLIAEILRKVDQVPARISDLIAQAADGNPFFVEELIKMLIEDGVIQIGEESWHIANQDLAGLQVPSTLTSVLQARLDRLPPKERVVLQQASVVGRTFWESAVIFLQAARGQGSAVTVAGHLDGLYAREMIFRREHSIFSDTPEYYFKHALLCDVTYESVLKRLRKIYHEQMAAWLIEHSRERQDEYLGVIGEHLERAEHIAEAVDYLYRAGERAAAVFASQEALDYFRRALALLPEDNVTWRSKILAARLFVSFLTGNRQQQAADLEILAGMADRITDDKLKAEIARDQADYSRRTGDYAQAFASAQQAIELGLSSGAEAVAARGYDVLANTLWQQGDFPNASQQALSGLTLARHCGDPAVECSLLITSGIMQCGLENYELAKPYFEQALEISRQNGDYIAESRAILNLADLICYREHDLLKARSWSEEGLRLTRQIGVKPIEGVILANLGDIEAMLGHYDRAQDYYQLSLAVMRRIGHYHMEPRCMIGLSDLLAIRGNFSEAYTLISQALSLGRERDDHQAEMRALYSMGFIQFSRGEFVEATACYQQALDLGKELDSRAGLAAIYAGLAETCLAGGDAAEALAWIENALFLSLELETPERILAPQKILLTCYQVLAANADPRATPILADAHQALQQWAIHIHDEQELDSFGENVPWNRMILQAWQACQTK